MKKILLTIICGFLLITDYSLADESQKTSLKDLNMNVDEMPAEELVVHSQERGCFAVSKEFTENEALFSTTHFFNYISPLRMKDETIREQYCAPQGKRHCEDAFHIAKDNIETSGYFGVYNRYIEKQLALAIQCNPEKEKTIKLIQSIRKQRKVLLENFQRYFTLSYRKLIETKFSIDRQTAQAIKIPTAVQSSKK
jgi:hypothetical protein